jgi:DNA-binding winged helix-turn-helix (wHTH) protein
MNNKPFVINNRFIIYPELSVITQKDTEKEIRVEPRIMNLLCTLVLYNHELVLRGLLIKTVWNNFGSANEGLTQAVSYLRKILEDDTESLIETVPIKGYILHAAINFGIKEEKTPAEMAKGKETLYWVLAVILTALIIIGYSIYKYN